MDGEWHVSRGWTSDPYAPDCGCDVAPCKGVVLNDNSKGCEQHDPMNAKTFRFMHDARNCPSLAEQARMGGGWP